ncbi:MAG: 3-dehydroquinate synthase [Methylophilaceae bacterium]
MEIVKIELGERGYDICVGSKLISQEDLLLKHILNKNIAIITNETVGPLYLEKLKKGLTKSKSIIDIVLKDGENYKNQESLDFIYEALLKNKYGRDSVLIALGGGVVGDITGYAAATYMRGIDFIQVPTTLLSQVDSSVGGKTGINHALGKNMIGAFYQPKLVVIDVDCLQSLPETELSAGLAEVIKYGLIRDFAFFEWLEKNMDCLLSKNSDCLIEAIIRSCKNKAQVVAEDEFETAKGIRATLNLGHTFGHAIETALGYGKWLHGQAVAAGMIMASNMSMLMGFIDNKDYNRIKKIIDSAGLPINPPDISQAQFLDLMASDKKNKDGKISLILLKELGKAFQTEEYDMKILEKTLNTKIF